MTDDRSRTTKPKRRHPARKARRLTGGLASTGAFAMLLGLAAAHPPHTTSVAIRSTPAEPAGPPAPPETTIVYVPGSDPAPIVVVQRRLLPPTPTVPVASGSGTGRTHSASARPSPRPAAVPTPRPAPVVPTPTQPPVVVTPRPAPRPTPTTPPTTSTHAS
jgi:hypothetical protein